MVKLWPAWMDSTPLRRLPKCRKDALERFHGGLGERRAEVSRGEDLREAVAMIGVLVGDEDCVEAIDAALDSGEASEEFRVFRGQLNEMRVLSVSSRVKLPELPEARMETPQPMRRLLKNRQGLKIRPALKNDTNIGNDGRGFNTRQRRRAMRWKT